MEASEKCTYEETSSGCQKKRKIRVVISTSINLIWGIVYVVVGKVYEDRDYNGYATSFLMVLENQI
jgi:hypothetical protein